MRSVGDVRVWGAALCVALVLSGCGGGGGGGAAAPSSSALPSTASPLATGPNVQPVVVNAGPAGVSGRLANVLFTSVKVCQPGSTSQCQIIDHVLVDTGSTGLRLLASELSVNLPGVAVGGKPLLNCVQFIDQSYMWGTVATADLYLGGSDMSGRKAANLPVQVVADSTAPPVPAVCAPTGYMANHTVAALGARGILGVGDRVQDCGTFCAGNASNGMYYTNTGGVAAGAAVSLAQQIQQPVSLFASDNNGVVISLPAVPDPGAATVNGALIFGIGTQGNNSLGTARVLALNGGGYFTTAFEGGTLTRGFVDSGSNGLFFGVSRFALCSGAPHWYCPADSTALQATNTGANGVAAGANFTVSNAMTLFGNGAFTAFGSLAGPSGDFTSFDFGLPFFYGRNVFTAIESKSTPGGVGPYVAYD